MSTPSTSCFQGAPGFRSLCCATTSSGGLAGKEGQARCCTRDRPARLSPPRPSGGSRCRSSWPHLAAQASCLIIFTCVRAARILGSVGRPCLLPSLPVWGSADGFPAWEASSGPMWMRSHTWWWAGAERAACTGSRAQGEELGAPAPPAWVWRPPFLFVTRSMRGIFKVQIG